MLDLMKSLARFSRSFPFQPGAPVHKTKSPLGHLEEELQGKAKTVKCLSYLKCYTEHCYYRELILPSGKNLHDYSAFNLVVSYFIDSIDFAHDLWWKAL